MSEQTSSDATVLRELRRVRRERRLGDTEWFDVLYRVYLFALVGTGVVLYASDSIAGLIDEPIPTSDLLTYGPSLAGIAAAVAIGIGLRNGSDGGPVSVESADVRHLLMSPLSRTRVLLRPIAQRIRSVAFGLALGVGVVAQLVGREVEGSRGAWAASGALFGALLGALYGATAVISHAARLRPWMASTISLGVIAWQCVVAWRVWFDQATGWERAGPTNLIGSVALWGIRQRWIDAAAIAVVVALVVVALVSGGRLRLQPLERRGQLVSQLRFAATVQDIRTVVLLRRQLRAESTRTRPWIRGRSHQAPGATPRPDRRPLAADSTTVRPGFVWTRGFAAFNRLPAARIVRIGALALLGGMSASLVVDESWLFLIGLVAAVYLLGLESLEPLAQEVDRPDLTDGFPIARGWLFAHHLLAPSVALAIAGLVGAIGATIVEPGHAAAAFALGIPVAWAGAIGAVVTTVGDAPDPPQIQDTTLTGAQRGAESPLALPEFAGFSNVGKGALPVILSSIAAGPIAAMRVDPEPTTIVRSLIGVALCLVVTVWWVVRRDRLSMSIRQFFSEGRAQSGFGGSA
jgi:hypothetical protein